MDDWKKQGIPLVRVSVNLSAKHFIKNNMEETISLVRQRTGASLQYLDLEITERTLMENTEEVITTLALLKEMGIGISIDDFGTGYSSLSYLTQLPFSALKIDKAFVEKIGKNTEDSSVVVAIIALARILKKEVVAEGVENTVQMNFLKSNGCNVIQGFLYSPAVPEQDVRPLLLAGHIQSLSAHVLEHPPEL
jgi:EAL domain-containing protein (putative c-di-GMP-specific phosphodiesterase class I)